MFFIDFFGEPVTPCGDCVDGRCTMNCSTPMKPPHPRLIVRIRHATRGAHVHCRFFAGWHDGALGNCGDLTMRVDEFEALKRQWPGLQFLPEDSA